MIVRLVRCCCLSFKRYIVGVQHLAAGSARCTAARVAALDRQWVRLEDEAAAALRLRQREREERAALALGRATQSSDNSGATAAGFANIDRQFDELMEKRGWESRVAHKREKISHATRLAILEEYVLQQRRACGAQKPPFEKHYDDYHAQLYKSCAKQVTVADMMAFIKGADDDDGVELAGAVYTSPEELERNAARPSRPRMVLYASHQNRSNLLRVQRWCGKSANVKLLKALGASTPSERHAIAAMVRKLCHPACICINCRAPSERFLSLTVHGGGNGPLDSGGYSRTSSPAHGGGNGHGGRRSAFGSTLSSALDSGGGTHWGGGRSPTMRSPSRSSSRGGASCTSPVPARFGGDRARSPDGERSQGGGSRPSSPASSFGSSRPGSPAAFMM